MEDLHYDTVEPKRRGRDAQAGGAKSWKTKWWQVLLTEMKSAMKKRKQEGEECKGAHGCHIGAVDAG